LPPTLLGRAGEAAHQLQASATFDGGLRYQQLITPAGVQALPGLVQFTSSHPQAVGISPDGGRIVLLANYHRPVEITVTAVGSGVQASAPIAANLLPAVGDVDLGGTAGAPVPAVTPGTEFTVAVTVNSGVALVGAVDLTLRYDTAAFVALAVEEGKDWAGGALLARLNDPPGVIVFGGTPSIRRAGSNLHLASVRLQAKADYTGVAALSGDVTTLATQAQTPIGGAESRAFVAGDITVQVARVGRRDVSTAAEEASLARPRAVTPRERRGARCSEAPCETCPGGAARETGDANGDCVFDLNDVTFTQQYLADAAINGGLALRPWQRAAMDVDLNGRVNPADAFYMARVNFGLLRFITDVVVTPTSASPSGCRLTVSCRVVGKGDAPAVAARTLILFDMESANPDIAADLRASRTRVGGPLVIPKDAQAGLHGAMLEAQAGTGAQADRWTLELTTPLDADTVGMSIVQATSDFFGRGSDLRTTFLFGSHEGPFEYPRVRIELTTLRQAELELPVSLLATQGYNPLLHFSNPAISRFCGPTCTETPDIFLLLDASGSVGAAGYARTVAFATALLEPIFLREDAGRVSAVVFESTPVRLFPLTAAPDLTSYAYRPNGGSSLAAALRLVREEITAAGSDYRGDGSVVVVTDGLSTEPAAVVASEAAALRDAGVPIYVVAVGLLGVVGPEDVQRLTGLGPGLRAWTADAYAGLANASLVADVAKRIMCGDSQISSTSTTTSTTFAATSTTTTMTATTTLTTTTADGSSSPASTTTAATTTPGTGTVSSSAAASSSTSATVTQGPTSTTVQSRLCRGIADSTGAACRCTSFGLIDCFECFQAESGLATCLTCKNGRFLSRGACVATCPPGTVGVGGGNFNNFCQATTTSTTGATAAPSAASTTTATTVFPTRVTTTVSTGASVTPSSVASSTVAATTEPPLFTTGAATTATTASTEVPGVSVRFNLNFDEIVTDALKVCNLATFMLCFGLGTCRKTLTCLCSNIGFSLNGCSHRIPGLQGFTWDPFGCTSNIPRGIVHAAFSRGCTGTRAQAVFPAATGQAGH